jgi:hypothetical protein
MDDNNGYFILIVIAVVLLVAGIILYVGIFILAGVALAGTVSGFIAGTKTFFDVLDEAHRTIK